MKCPDCEAVWYEDFHIGPAIFKCPLCGYPYQNDCCGREERDEQDAFKEMCDKLMEGKEEEICRIRDLAQEEDGNQKQE